MVTSVSQEAMRRNLEAIAERIAAAAARSGRKPADISLVAVSKFQPLEALYTALDCGVTLFGENRVQEREEKNAAWARERATWHMIGHLQRNKARKALELFDCIESVDSFELAAALNRILEEKEAVGEGQAGRRYPILVEVNTSGEASKQGVEPVACRALAERIAASCPRLETRGLMTIGPLTEEERAIRAAFALLRTLAEDIRERAGLPLPELSMGMSGDYETAVEEGSTLVRIGTGIFGARR